MTGELWGTEHAADEFGSLGRNVVLQNVHSPDKCAGRPCVLHNPTDHNMRSWPSSWRDDRRLFERICPKHGTGHPDPDQEEFFRSVGREADLIHGCCGCCRSGGET